MTAPAGWSPDWNASTVAASVLVDELARNGLRDAVVAPGSRSAPLALALAGHPGVRLHVRHDERSAAFLAVGLTRGHGGVVLVGCTSGTAAANLHPAVLEADAAGLPLIVATGDRPPELRGVGANQTTDQIKLYGAAVRDFVEVGVPETGAGTVRYLRALASRVAATASGALGAPAGPVHLNLAYREPLVPAGPAVPWDLGARPDGAPWTWVDAEAEASHRHVAAVLHTLTDTERALIVAGDIDPWTGSGLTELAVQTSTPVLAEPQSGARHGPTAVGAYDLLLASGAFAEAHRPDAVVVVGRATLSRRLLEWLDPDVPQVHLSSHRISDPGLGVERVISGHVRRIVDAAAAELRLTHIPEATETSWLRSWRRADATAQAAVDAVLSADGTLNEPRLARDLVALLPDEAVLVAASSMPVRDLNAFSAPRPGARVVANRGVSGIDGFVSTAVGVALTHDGPVFALAGDLSLIHDVNGLLIAEGEARPDLPLVVVNNDGGGIFSLLPQAGHPAFERVFGTPHGLDLAALATAYGCGHRRVAAPGELRPALEAARADGGIQVLEVRTDRRANAELHRRLVTAVVDALT